MVCPDCGGKDRGGVCARCGRVLYVGGPAPERRSLGRGLAAAVGGLLVLALLAWWLRPLLASLSLPGGSAAACPIAGSPSEPPAPAGAETSSAMPTAAAPGRVLFSGSIVSAATGEPIPNGLVFLNQMSFTADAKGHWWKEVPSAATIDLWIVAPGYQAYHGRTEVPDASSGVRVNPIATRLETVFAARDEFSNYPGHVAPAITEFGAEGGPAFSQALPAGTQAAVVCGTAGLRDGQPAVDAKAWLAQPDGFVHSVPVAMANGRFAATFSLGASGRYQLEVNDRSGSAILNVPLFVGIPYTFQPPAEPSGAGGEQAAMAALNGLRQQQALPPLALDPRLSEVAAQHIADWGGRTGLSCPHCWSDGAPLADHILASGVQPAKQPVASSFSDPASLLSFGRFSYAVAEGLTRGMAGGAVSIQALWDSPAHRSDLLGDYNHAGIATAGSGPDRAFVIEYAKED